VIINLNPIWNLDLVDPRYRTVNVPTPHSKSAGGWPLIFDGHGPSQTFRFTIYHAVSRRAALLELQYIHESYAGP
jgi:hypothetical protein